LNALIAFIRPDELGVVLGVTVAAFAFVALGLGIVLHATGSKP
jgi:hypothetical protein